MVALGPCPGHAPLASTKPQVTRGVGQPLAGSTLTAAGPCATCGQEFTPIRRDRPYGRRWCREHSYLARVAGGPRTRCSEVEISALVLA
jgi:hypothetical protein